MPFFFFFKLGQSFQNTSPAFSGLIIHCGQLGWGLRGAVWKHLYGIFCLEMVCLLPRSSTTALALKFRSTMRILCGNLQLLSPLLVPREVQIWQKSPEMLNSESIGANTDLSASVLFHSLRSSGFKTPRSQIKRCVIETTLLKADGCCSSHLFTCSFILLWKACLIQGSVVGSVGDTSLWGSLPPLEPALPLHFLLWLISKLL